MKNAPGSISEPLQEQDPVTVCGVCTNTGIGPYHFEVRIKDEAYLFVTGTVDDHRLCCVSAAEEDVMLEMTCQGIEDVNTYSDHPWADKSIHWESISVEEAEDE
jgi:hypothetical protein